MDWNERRDGRSRNNYYEPPEVEIFGEKKAVVIGINFDEYDKIPVELAGDNIDDLANITRFSEADLHDCMVKNLIERCGYQRPTPIQKHSFVVVAAGRDLMACAQTGSGKTCAFIVPIINKMLKMGPPPYTCRTPSPCCLVLAPTRELASQIWEESRKFAYETGVRSVVVYGGAPMQEQRQQLMKGTDVMVATPGRLTDMSERRMISLALVSSVILDEADRMLDMGFEPQVRHILNETDLAEKLGEGERCQSMMFSATFPKEVQWLARDFLENYIFLSVGRVGSTNEFITQSMVYADEHTKLRMLLKLLDDHFMEKEHTTKALVFVETKRGADNLEKNLYYEKVPVTSIHGDRSQREREEALKMFRNGECSVLVATDVAARGLDIPDVELVVQYDLPNNIDDYVHRIGRTGRAGRKGTAMAMINESCNRSLLKELSNLLTEAKQERPLWFQELVRAGGGGGGRYGNSRAAGGKGEKGEFKSRFAGTQGAKDIREGNVQSKKYVDNRKTGGIDEVGAKRGGAAAAPDIDDGW